MLRRATPDVEVLYGTDSERWIAQLHMAKFAQLRGDISGAIYQELKDWLLAKIEMDIDDWTGESSDIADVRNRTLRDLLWSIEAQVTRSKPSVSSNAGRLLNRILGADIAGFKGVGDLEVANGDGIRIEYAGFNSGNPLDIPVSITFDGASFSLRQSPDNTFLALSIGDWNALYLRLGAIGKMHPVDDAGA